MEENPPGLYHVRQVRDGSDSAKLTFNFTEGSRPPWLHVLLLHLHSVPGMYTHTRMLHGEWFMETMRVLCVEPTKLHIHRLYK